MVYIKTYMFNHFWYQYLVLLTMVPRNVNIYTYCCSRSPSSARFAFVVMKAIRSHYCYFGEPWLIGPMLYMKTYTFNHFYRQYLVLSTMVPRNP